MEARRLLASFAHCNGFCVPVRVLQLCTPCLRQAAAALCLCSRCGVATCGTSSDDLSPPRCTRSVNPLHQTSQSHKSSLVSYRPLAAKFKSHPSPSERSYPDGPVPASFPVAMAGAILTTCAQHNLSSAQTNSTGSFVDARNLSQGPALHSQRARPSAATAEHKRPH